MNIAVLGAGAMGSLFGGYLSKNNNVTLVDLSETIVNAINENGVRIKEKDGSIKVVRPLAVTDASSLGPQDLVIVFVKSMFTAAALDKNKNLIGESTFLMTLQNGAGHETKLLGFANRDHTIIGTTQHNSSLIEPGFICHGGYGKTNIGLLGKGDVANFAEEFTMCGLECNVVDNVQKQIWKKLFTNTAASSLTALFQVPLIFIHENPDAFWIMNKLCSEAVSVANALGLGFDEQEVLSDVDNVCANAPNGYTSIYADIRDGRKTEVDTISGSVVEAANDVGISVPCHEMLVKCIHALEAKNKEKTL